MKLHWVAYMYNDTIHNLLVLLNSLAQEGNSPAIRRIINSMNRNQVKSKTWLFEETEKWYELYSHKNPKILVAAGWYGLMAHLMRGMTNNRVVSFDIDDNCKRIGHKLFMDSKIEFVTEDIEKYDPSDFDILVCTSCEHMTDKTLNTFLNRRRKGCLVSLQSNNFVTPSDQEDGHINTKDTLDDFIKSLDLKRILHSDTKPMHPHYTRYLVIGI